VAVRDRDIGARCRWSRGKPGGDDAGDQQDHGDGGKPDTRAKPMRGPYGQIGLVGIKSPVGRANILQCLGLRMGAGLGGDGQP